MKSNFGYTLWGIVAALSAGACAYHGYRRNGSENTELTAIGWASAWALCGALFPIVTPAIAIAQGFGKPA
jgi:hypothetical protein